MIICTVGALVLLTALVFGMPFQGCRHGVRGRRDFVGDNVRAVGGHLERDGAHRCLGRHAGREGHMLIMGGDCAIGGKLVAGVYLPAAVMPPPLDSCTKLGQKRAFDELGNGADQG